MTESGPTEQTNALLAAVVASSMEVSWIATALVPKQLELLRRLTPNPAVIGALVNPNYPGHDLQLRELEEAGAAIRQEPADYEVAAAPHRYRDPSEEVVCTLTPFQRRSRPHTTSRVPARSPPTHALIDLRFGL